MNPRGGVVCGRKVGKVRSFLLLNENNFIELQILQYALLAVVKEERERLLICHLYCVKIDFYIDFLKYIKDLIKYKL